ncbi:hypothetical protein [Solimonas soli]|uniref:hypothetical protein n=1 Tax=Solimonas soli TaxID=413479 RepID=UPI0004814322|nr:hypothetical protein [Solimonas soli]
MKSLQIALLCLLTALLPLDGLARVSAVACAAHRGGMPVAGAPVAHAPHGGGHHAMPMPGMAPHAHVGTQTDTHEGCRCAGVCAAHCAAASVMASLTAPSPTARGEAPLALAGRDPQPARRLDLLRPPAGTRV